MKQQGLSDDYIPMRVPYYDMVSVFSEVLQKHGMDADAAGLSAKLFADSSADGVHSHGLNRFPRYISYIKEGYVDVTKTAVRVEKFGGLERWDGQLGPGDINAWICMDRAVKLAKQNTIGAVALGNTNHWMRAGNYGLLAASEDCVGICWTNTTPNLPPWGGTDCRLGNNPLVIAVPYQDCPVLVDVAMSMFSYGKLEKLAMDGMECPVDAGFDREGNLTKDPEAVLETMQPLPMGYWKGSGLSLALDLIAAILSGGSTVRTIGDYPAEIDLSQFFLAIDLSSFPDRIRMEAEIISSLEYMTSSRPRVEGRSVHYPGQGRKRTREESMRLGVYADDRVWQEVLELLEEA